ncbi:MAG: dihydropteroate synthase, partial [Myxococcales bacterium]|nr:dihydropteroate synthase [Myxococcales bacterium]
MTGSAARSEPTQTHGAPREAAAPSAVGACEVWGVLNVTPDSFSDGGRFLDEGAAVARGLAMVREGAAVVDVGGESSRPKGHAYGPGAEDVSVAEELRRVLPVVRALAEQGVRVSIDTIEAEVADACLDAGAQVVNDVSMGRSDALLAVCAARGAELVLMHTRGRGEVCPPGTVYGDVVADVRAELLSAVDRAARLGVARSRIWLDPGLGFA